MKFVINGCLPLFFGIYFLYKENYELSTVCFLISSNGFAQSKDE